MKRKIRRLLFSVLFLLLLSGTMHVQAARNMKSTTGITWGLKVNKKYTYYSYWGGNGMIKQKFRITNWHDEWSGNKGMRRLTFRITYTRKKKPTARKLIKAATYYTVKHPELDTSPRCWYAIVDYDSGISLEDPANPYGVIVSNNWRKSSTTTYRTRGYSISMTNAVVDVQIEYPSSYKGICIGIGGCTSAIRSSSEQLFWDGIYPFWMTDTLHSEKRKKIARFARWYY